VKKIFLILICLIFSSFAVADSKIEQGLEIFNSKAQCGMCHTLQSAGSKGQIGVNLDQLKPLMAQVIAAVTNGIGVMPSFDGMLSSEEIEAVSYFVSTSTNQ
jgi:mono/diheme cytochrome c family protein